MTVVKANADATISGTAVTANTDGSYTLNLSGTVNATKNVFLGTGRTITVVGELDDATSIPIQTASVTYTIRQAVPQAGDFAFSPPDTLTYDGSARTAAVAARAGIAGMGGVTVKYYRNGVKVEQPADVGTYNVRIDVAEGKNYDAAADLTDDSWTFTIHRAAYGDRTVNGSAMYDNNGTVDLSSLIAEGGTAVLGSVAVFALVRRWGRGLVEVFFPADKLEKLHFLLRTSPKRTAILWLIFTVLGTPKDLLCYFAGLPDLPWRTWLLLATVGRLPSIVTSTVGGSALGEQNYRAAVIAFAIALAVAGAGYLIYRAVCRRHEQNGHKETPGG